MKKKCNFDVIGVEIGFILISIKTKAHIFVFILHVGFSSHL